MSLSCRPTGFACAWFFLPILSAQTSVIPWSAQTPFALLGRFCSMMTCSEHLRVRYPMPMRCLSHVTMSTASSARPFVHLDIPSHR